MGVTVFFAYNRRKPLWIQNLHKIKTFLVTKLLWIIFILWSIFLGNVFIKETLGSNAPIWISKSRKWVKKEKREIFRFLSLSFSPFVFFVSLLYFVHNCFAPMGSCPFSLKSLLIHSILLYSSEVSAEYALSQILWRQSNIREFFMILAPTYVHCKHIE